ncbi:PAS domain-containing protein [Xanthomonas arboricola]|uniref:PAS domain-containing protein n=2 Tax=Xanthomonas cannabis TaxID=1885674 RepID=A0ABR6JIW7_9XANT|nr:PAS domain-containing protein [Xanthomonas cannabis]MBB5520628.1 PAS domain-containing protein [Xanthomonas cannabis]
MRDRYRQIVALSRDCIKEIDLDGRITAVNVNGLTVLGASHQD